MLQEHDLLAKDWAFKPALDVELKHYTLLAYLKRVQARFAECKLFPHLLELRSHLEELQRIRQGKEDLARAFQGDLTSFDPRTGFAIHEPLPADPHLDVIDEVIDMALPDLRRAWLEGNGLKEEVTSQIHFAPVGVLPLARNEGWLLLRSGSEARVYRYSIPLLRSPDALAGTLHVRTHYTTTYPVGISYTFEHIKSDLCKEHRSLPNPAVFAFETALPIPHIETFMPLAKQLVHEEIRRGL